LEWWLVRFLDLTLGAAADNLALDEALLEDAEAAGDDGEVLRLWEPAEFVAVVGRSSRLTAEVNLDACRCDRVPILRRTSGGAAILSGPGCLMYCVVLSLERRPELRDVSSAHRFVLGKLIEAISPYAGSVACRGTSDLAIDGRKVSGNSLRLRRRYLLYHGTLLYRFTLDAIERYLVMPPRMPEYRARRSHRDFVTNLPVEGAALRASLAQAWQAGERLNRWPDELTRRLAADKYSQAAWNEQLV